MNGFFQPDADARRPLPLLPRCGACGLYKGCITPRMAVRGRGKKGILVVGEAPGADEDRTGGPFVGRSGDYLRRALARLEVDLDADCWATNALICRPPDNVIGREERILDCRPNLFRVLRDLDPVCVVLLGGVAVKSLIGRLWKENTGGVFRWAGYAVPCREPNAWVCPTFHPSFLLRQDDRAADLIFARHLRRAVRSAAGGRPWKTPPDYRGRVRVLADPEEAAAAVSAMTAEGGPLAFDYETNMLKPYSPDAFIACASVGDSRRAVAFPMVGIAVKAVKDFLRSPVPKVGYNQNFETAWSQAVLKVTPRNWTWDGMVQAHVLDNRPGVTGLKFQAFVRLGQGDYASAVSPYLKSAGLGGYAPNRVRQAPQRDLLTYCGMDSLLESLVHDHQRAEMARRTGDADEAA